MRAAKLVIPALLLVACASTDRPDLAKSAMVDLSWPLDQNTLYWPNSPSAFQLKQDFHGRTAAGFFYSSNSFCSPEHGGTHMDAPVHFSEGKRSVDDIGVRELVAPAVVIDITAQAKQDPDYRLTAYDVRSWEARHGEIKPGTFVLLRTGWSSRYPDRKRYFGDDRPGATDNLHFPSYGESAARLLVERRVGALGVDTASIDYGQSQDFIVHQIVNGADIPGLENLMSLEQVPERGAWVVALPMKIANGSGAPLRVIAIVPR